MILKRLLFATPSSSRYSSRLVDPAIIQDKISKLPFFVERTKLGRNLPVYTNFTHQGNKKTTIIRHIYGNIHVLRKQLLEASGIPTRTPTNVRPDKCQIDIKGNHASIVRKYLAELGF